MISMARKRGNCGALVAEWQHEVSVERSGNTEAMKPVHYLNAPECPGNRGANSYCASRATLSMAGGNYSRRACGKAATLPANRNASPPMTSPSTGSTYPVGHTPPFGPTGIFN